MKYVVIYEDASGQTRYEWAWDEEGARWVLNNLKRLGISAKAYRLELICG